VGAAGANEFIGLRAMFSEAETTPALDNLNSIWSEIFDSPECLL
jgi:hypothetical protein